MPKLKKSTSRKPWTKQLQSLKKMVSSASFARIYVWAALGILCATTIFWSLLGARVQQVNADQLISSLLFEHTTTFHGALFPGQHTFLIKWPLFLLVRLFGASPWATITATIGLVLVTVAGFVAVLYRIEKRPLVFGSLCLALASVLLMIPAEPYAGGLLPVNMAMLSTRNIEYLLYIGSLIFLITSARLRSWRFLLAILALTLLFASDKLFLTMSIVGALGALVIYALLQAWNMATLSVRWFIGGVLGAIGATILLWLINVTGFTHVVSQSSVGPYGVTHSFHDVFIGSFYAVIGLLTNFGANPASNYAVIRNIPSQVYHGLIGIGGLTFIINALLLLGGLYAVYRLLRTSLTKSKPRVHQASSANLGIMLIWTTAVSFGVFIFSQHDYTVDARYLTIGLFTIFVAGALYLRTRKWQPHIVVAAGIVLLIGIVLGLFATFHTYRNETAALSTLRQRSTLIDQAMHHHQVDTLVGDYWRVVPAKLTVQDKLNIAPLTNCTQLRNILSSTTWQVNLHTHSFAYLLSLDKSLTGSPACSIKQAVAAYGKPDESSLIAGSLSNPKELLLFYDHGIQSSSSASTPSEKVPSTIIPVGLSSLDNSICSKPTVMNVVAHEDDDLLFMNPDLQHSISAGDCVRTIYITAGDAGQGKFYWLDREQGAEAAYSHMLGSKAVWIQRIVQLANHEYVTIANPKGNHRISLIFMHLPDGNLSGQGFQVSGYQSLAKLESGDTKVFNSVDGQSYYGLSQLTNALTTFMHTYQPAVIRTQANYVSASYPDHSDHIAVGSIVTSAYRQYEQQQYGNQVTIPINYYIGYPIHGMPANVTSIDLQKKEATYLVYAKYDAAVCQTLKQCQLTATYGSYLTRQYQYKS